MLEPSTPRRRVSSIHFNDSIADEDAEQLTAITHKIFSNIASSDSSSPEPSRLRPALIQTGDIWSKRSSKLPLPINLGLSERISERQKAFALLEALSCSGSLPIRFSEIHTIVGLAHFFENSLLDTVIMQNVSPIDELSRSTLQVASAIFGVSSDEIVEKTGGES
ncbi:hypothetical protein ACHAXS_006013 [Conticribra weissflogii]